MEQPKFCVLIPLKDINPPYFIHTLHYLQHFLCPESIIILTSMAHAKQSPNFQTLSAISGITWIDEASIYEGLNIESVKAKMHEIDANSTWRAGWYLQQFLKMAFALYALQRPLNMGGGATYPIISFGILIPFR